MPHSKLKRYTQMLQALTGSPLRSTQDPGIAEIEAKLMPEGGPTTADLSGCDSESLDSLLLERRNLMTKVMITVIIRLRQSMPMKIQQDLSLIIAIVCMHTLIHC